MGGTVDQNESGGDGEVCVCSMFCLGCNVCVCVCACVLLVVQGGRADEE